MTTIAPRFHAGRYMLGRLIALTATVVAGIIVAGILLVVLKANLGNDIASAVHDAAKWLAGPFDGLFSFDNHRTEIAVNWGIAAAVYFIGGRLLAGFVRR
jgi:hypothetical protein